MKDFPTLDTECLLLRQFRMSDAAGIQRLAGAFEIARGTLVPHPYEDGMAEAWIASQANDYEAGKLVNFAIVLKSEEALVGSMGLTLAGANRHATLGYWIGVPFWGQGYCTEAAKAVVDYGFKALDLNRVSSHPMGSNPASSRVLQKIGMRYEGCQRQHHFRWGRYEVSSFTGCCGARLMNNAIASNVGGVGTLVFLVVDQMHVASNKEAGVQPPGRPQRR